MIKKLSYNQIDFGKYIQCLDQSVQRKSYAYPHYLDAVCGKDWDLLVSGDYEAVMPIPFIKKFGIKLVVNPKLCQQLGVFSKEDDLVVNDLFLNYFNKKCNIWYYAFNDVNVFTTPMKLRNNFLIPINDYEEVRQKYSPKRKRKLRLDQEVLEQSTFNYIKDFNTVSDFIRQNVAGVNSDKDIAAFTQVFSRFHQQDNIEFFAFYYQQKIINMIAVYVDQQNAILLGTFNHKDYIKLAGASVLIDKTIAHHIPNKIFDFEGSDLPNVEEFFRGFRPDLRPYPCISYSKIEIIKNFIK